MLKTTKMSRAVMPSMLNCGGVLFGGILMEWMEGKRLVSTREMGEEIVKEVEGYQI